VRNRLNVPVRCDAQVRNNQTLSPNQRDRILGEKLEALLKPSIASLERCKASVFAPPPECDHDRSFISTFQPAFESLMSMVKGAPHAGGASEAGALDATKSLLQKVTRQLRKPTLSLSAISPYLATIRPQGVPMPGDLTPGGGVTLAGFGDVILCMPTKTKPKKVTLISSDGKQSSFLLKGREDLHLDERMMQLLSIVNRLMRSNKNSSTRNLSSRHYSVIPLGPRSGLIQWVEGTAPLYSMYNRWQAREGKAQRPR